MIDRPITCYDRLKCVKALNMMFNSRVDSLMVIDRQGHFKGVIHAADAADEKIKMKLWVMLCKRNVSQFLHRNQSLMF